MCYAIWERGASHITDWSKANAHKVGTHVAQHVFTKPVIPKFETKHKHQKTESQSFHTKMWWLSVTRSWYKDRGAKSLSAGTCQCSGPWLLMVNVKNKGFSIICWIHCSHPMLDQRQTLLRFGEIPQIPLPQGPPPQKKNFILEWDFLNTRNNQVPWKPPFFDVGSISQTCPEAVHDGLVHPEVMKLAGIGSRGSQPSHCSRDLVRSLRPSFDALPDISFINVPVQPPRQENPIIIELEVQYPHDVISFYSQFPTQFRQIFGTPLEIQRFWARKDLADPAFRHHPAVNKVDFETKCIPVRLHSDGAVMSKVDTLHVVSWSSYFGQGAVLEWQLLFGAVVKGAVCTHNDQDTLGEMYKALRWSLEACLAGCHPGRNYKGELWPPGSKRAQLAGQRLHPDGYYLGVFQVLGDLDELCNSLGLKHFNSNTPCFWCECDVRAVPWSDLSPAAAWRATVLQAQPAMPAPSEHEVWKISGLTVLSVGWDILHGLDLGPCLHVAGNVLEDLLELRTLGRTVEDRLKQVWSQCQEVYTELSIPNRLPYLELACFRKPQEYPKLRAKGNEARHFARVLKRLLEINDVGNDEYAMRRKEVVDSLVRLYEILDHNDLFLPRVLVMEGQTVIAKFLRAYNWLAHSALQGGRLRWQLTVKFHYLAHAAELLQWTNLKFSSTYPGEAFVGKVAKIAWTASLGKPAYSLGGLLMQKIQAGRAIRMRRQLLWGPSIGPCPL